MVIHNGFYDDVKSSYGSGVDRNAFPHTSAGYPNNTD
jgi:hypothetical protein